MKRKAGVQVEGNRWKRGRSVGESREMEVRAREVGDTREKENRRGGRVAGCREG